MFAAFSDPLAFRRRGGPEHPDSGFWFSSHALNCAIVRKKLRCQGFQVSRRYSTRRPVRIIRQGQHRNALRKVLNSMPKSVFFPPDDARGDVLDPPLAPVQTRPSSSTPTRSLPRTPCYPIDHPRRQRAHAALEGPSGSWCSPAAGRSIRSGGKAPRMAPARRSPGLVAAN